MTRDLDLLGYGSPDPERIRSVFERACAAEVPDGGVTYDPDSLATNSIRTGAHYDGLRVRLRAYIGSARLSLQIDVGFGDAVTPSPVRKTFPGLLDFPEPTISTYPPETTVSEKLHGMVHLGRANSRMKDFYDVWRISRVFSLEGKSLRDAIQATFEHRKLSLPEEPPVGLTDEFADDSSRKQQWEAFAGRLGLELSLGDVLSDLRSFLLPILRAARNEEPPPDHWHPEEGWINA